MIVIGDHTYAPLSAPQRAVLALKAAWAGKRPDPRLLIMPGPQRAEFDRLYRQAALANMRLGKLIRKLHAQAEQERLTVAAWEIASFHAGVLDELRWSLGEVGDRKVATVLEGGRPYCCPRSLDLLDETPAGRQAQVLNGSRERLVGIANRAHAAAEIFESIQEALGADPLQPELRAILDETLDFVDDVLFTTVAWLGPVCIPYDPVADAEVQRLVEAP